jgi:hypothetical protein
MVEEQNDSVTIEDFQNAFPNNESDDSLANAMAATTFFTEPNLSQKELLELVSKKDLPNTKNLLTRLNAEEQRNLVFASVIEHIANFPNSNFIFNEDSFRETVKKPMSNWSVSPDATEKDEIKAMRKKTESKIIGVLWTLYSDELKVRNLLNENQLVEGIFFGRDYPIRPDSFSRSTKEDYLKKLQD